MRAVLITIASLALAAAASADPEWTAPGWYQVEASGAGRFLYSDRFDNQKSCEATLPASNEEFEYECRYLNERLKI